MLKDKSHPYAFVYLSEREVDQLVSEYLVEYERGATEACRLIWQSMQGWGSPDVHSWNDALEKGRTVMPFLVDPQLPTT